MVRVKLLKSISVMLAVFPTTLLASTPLKSPEIEVLSAFDRIDALSEKLESEENLSSSKGFGTAPIDAHKAYNHAMKAFKNEEYLSALRNLNYYFEKTNIPDHSKHTNAYKISAKSAKRIGRYKLAFDHYLEFLSFSSKKGTSSNTDIRDAVAEVLDLTTIIKPRKKYQLSQILSSIISLDTPDELKAEILFLAAKSATNFDMEKLATKWINEARATTKSSSLHLKGMYYQALIEVSKGDLETARQILLAALNHKGGNTTPDEYAIAQIALARISYTIGDHKEAIQYYQSIDRKTSSYTDASYEMIFSLFKQGDSKKAYDQAKKFVEENPSHENTKFSNSLVTYLGVKSGILSETETNILTDIKFLTTFTRELRGKLEKGQNLVEKDMSDLKVSSNGFASQSPYLERSIKVFESLNKLENLAAKIQGKITGLITDLWNARLHDINPQHIGRTEQLKTAIYELLDIGHRLTASEVTLAKGKLAPEDLLSIQRSINRRISLLSKHGEFRRYQGNIEELVSSINLNTKIENIQENLLSTGMKINTLDYMTKNSKDVKTQFNMKSLKARHTKATQLLSESIATHRGIYVKNLYQQSPLRTTKELMITYSLDLLNESRTLANWRDKNLDPVTKKLSWQYHDAWIKWFNAADELFHRVSEEEKDLKKTTEGMVEEIAGLQAQKQKLLMSVFKLREQLSATLGEGSSLLLSHYTNAADTRISEKQKWLADIEWLKYQNIENDSKQLNQEYKNQRRTLNENLTDQLRGLEQ